jgi:hypothetical protein
MQQTKEPNMPTTERPEAPRARETSPVSLLTEWVRQGTESFFAAQQILLDLVTRLDNSTTIRDGQSHPRPAPTAVLTEAAGEGLSNFIAAQRVLLQLAQRQNEIVLGAAEERMGVAPVMAVTDLLRRGIDNFIDMQQHFLTIASKQTDEWIDAAKEGKAFEGKRVAELANEAMENFVRSQKKFLDVVAEETAHATGQKKPTEAGHKKTAELAELAREGAEAFIDAQKKLIDIASQQVAVNVKVARRTAEAINPIPSGALAEMTRQTVGSVMTAQNALLDVFNKPAHRAQAKPAAAPRKKPPTEKRPVAHAVHA